MIKSVIFDLDGTLLDTSEGVISSVLKMIKHYGYHDLTRAELESFIGPPISKSLVRLYGVSDEEGLEAMLYFRKLYTKGVDAFLAGETEELPDVFNGEIYPGMEELLQGLKNHGIKVGVATYKQEDQAKKLLAYKGLAKYFDVIHGADPHGKLTKAEVVALSIKDLGAAPEETIMVGDSDNDAIGAEAAGALFLGVTYGFGFKTTDDVEGFKNVGVAATTYEALDIILNVDENA